MISRRELIAGGLAGACGVSLSIAGSPAVNLPFKYVKVPGAKALKELEAIERSGQGYPVILGDQEAFSQMQELMSISKKSVEEIIQLSSEIDPKTWFQTRAAEDPEYFAFTRGPWPEDAKPPTEIMGNLDITTGKPLREVYIGIIPVNESWKAPCVLQFGGWNACPFPQEHAAVLRSWNSRYGADVVTMAADTVEMRVKRPPTSRAEALELAKEQFVYCADIVDQGTGTIDALAAGLLNSPVWFFWWD